MSNESPAKKLRARIVAQLEAQRAVNAAVLSGVAPIVASVGDERIRIAVTSVDQDVLASVLRRRLLADERLSGTPLWRIVSSMPGVRAGISAADYSAALERALEVVAFFAGLSVVAGLGVFGTGGKAVSPDKLIKNALKNSVEKLRFCATCGKPFRFGRRAKKRCGDPGCRPIAPRRRRPGHAIRVSAVRWKRFRAEAVETIQRATPGARLSARDRVSLLEKYREDDPAAERELDMLAESDPEIWRLVNRLTRYRSSHRRRRRMLR